VERRVVRAGGQPASAPWWTLVFVVVGGLLFLGALNVVGGLIVQATYGMQSGTSAALVLVSWTFGLLRLALLVRVLSSWFQISPWSRWIRWSYVLTDWMLVPIRRLLPNFGPLDLSPLVAYFLLGILQSILGIP
jgi:YggT family protein